MNEVSGTVLMTEWQRMPFIYFFFGPKLPALHVVYAGNGMQSRNKTNGGKSSGGIDSDLIWLECLDQASLSAEEFCSKFQSAP
jgi:hypothetical protein